MVAQLTKLIESKKSELSPSIKELRVLRSQAQEIEVLELLRNCAHTTD